ncbi:MAG: hypothetical protein ACKESB_03195 [Candidatus Hodgkinia cicadicola]
MRFSNVRKESSEVGVISCKRKLRRSGAVQESMMFNRLLGRLQQCRLADAEAVVCAYLEMCIIKAKALRSSCASGRTLSELQ